MARFCSQCGASLSGGKFCTQCGAPTGDGVEPDLSGFDVQETEAMPVAYVAQTTASQAAPQKGMGSGTKTALIAAACVLGIGLGAFLGIAQPWAKHSSAPTETPAATTSTSGTTAPSSDAPAQSSGSDNASETQSAAAPQTQDYTSQQQSVRDAALKAGMQVFTGTVKLTTYADRAREVEPRLHDFDSYTNPLAILELDGTTPIYGRNGDGMGSRTQDGNSIGLDYDVFKNYGGKRITIAAYGDDLWWPSDVTGVLYSVGGPTTLLYEDGQAPVISADTLAAQARSDYVLPDSATRAYSRGELEGYSNHDLFIARNEIYARHGRGFKNQELRNYFAGKSWYRETVSPDSFNERVLNETERANAALMLEIEKSRNSPYL